MKLPLSFLVRLSVIVLDRSKENCECHIFAVSVLEVLNNFMENLFITNLVICIILVSRQTFEQ